jgi:hypothetical protein
MQILAVMTRNKVYIYDKLFLAVQSLCVSFPISVTFRLELLVLGFLTPGRGVRNLRNFLAK